MQKQTLGVLAAMFILMTGLTARAETDAGVTASGHASQSLKPEIMRVSIVITADGKDISDALAKLKAQRDQAKTNMTTAGASEASIRFSDPIEGADANLSPQQRQIQQYQRMEMNMRNRAGAASQPSTFTVSTVLTAEWPLTGATPDETLAAATGIKDKIKASLPKSTAPAAPKTPEEEEIAEEMVQRDGMPGAAKNEPTIIFIHKLTDADRAKVAAAAFTDSQKQAGVLAVAAGKQLGDLQTLSTTTTDAENPYLAYENSQLNNMITAAGADTANEAAGSDLSGVIYSVNLQAEFKFK